MSEESANPSYGVLEQRSVVTELDRAAEEIEYRGYAVIASGHSARQITAIGELFDSVHEKYVETYGKDYLVRIDEYNGIRLPLAFDAGFADLAMNPVVLELVGRLIRNKFILNQQNGIINPPGRPYNQGAWHRDLPYQHFVSSRPLAINALYCVDDFTAENGASLVLPASHTREKFPSDAYVRREARQISAPAGYFIVLDCMLFHRGGENSTSARRRAVNHVYSAAFIKQQIDIPSAIVGQYVPSPEARDLLGYRYQMPRTVAEFLESRQKHIAAANA